jgi:hypothetical protein
MYYTEADFNALLSEIHKTYPLIPLGDRIISLDAFTMIEKGEEFEVAYCWEVQPYLFLLSVLNSFRHDIPRSSSNMSGTEAYNFFYCYSTLSKVIPHTIIRPNSLGEMFVNLFTHTHTKMPYHTSFNLKYLVETKDPERLINVLNNDVLDAIEQTDEVFVEIIDKQCLVMNLRPANYEDVMRFVEISRSLLAL